MGWNTMKILSLHICFEPVPSSANPSIPLGGKTYRIKVRNIQESSSTFCYPKIFSHVLNNSVRCKWCLQNRHEVIVYTQTRNISCQILWCHLQVSTFTTFLLRMIMCFLHGKNISVSSGFVLPDYPYGNIFHILG